MRRALAILIMFLLPIQITWAAAAALHGHWEDAAPSLAFHSHADSQGHDHGDDLGHSHGHDHDHDHHFDAQADHAGGGVHEPTGGEHRDGHCHPVFPLFIAEVSGGAVAAPSGIPAPAPSRSFSSRIPPLFDRPPLAAA